MERMERTIVGELIDREKIKEALYRYCWAVDHGTAEEIMAVFSRDCDLELVPGKRYRGRAAVHRWFSEFVGLGMGALRHLIHNQVIDLHGDEATSRSCFDATTDLRGEAIVVGGWYEDKLHREDGEWKFTDKIIHIDFFVPLLEGWSGERYKRNLGIDF